MFTKSAIRPERILVAALLLVALGGHAVTVIDHVPRFSAHVTEPVLSNILIDAERLMVAHHYANAAQLYNQALSCTVPATRVALKQLCDDVPLALRLTVLRLECLGKSSWYRNTAISNEAHTALLAYAIPSRAQAWRDYSMLYYHLARYYTAMRDMQNLITINAARIAYHPDSYAVKGLIYLDEKTACGALTLERLLSSYFAHGGSSNAYTAYVAARGAFLQGHPRAAQSIILKAFDTWPNADNFILQKLLEMGSALIAGINDPWLTQYRDALSALALRQSSAENRVYITAFIISEITKLRTISNAAHPPDDDAQ